MADNKFADFKVKLDTGVEAPEKHCTGCKVWGSHINSHTQSPIFMARKKALRRLQPTPWAVQGNARTEKE